MKKYLVLAVLIISIVAVCIADTSYIQLVYDIMENYQPDQYQMVTNYYSSAVYQNGELYPKIDISRYNTGLSDFEKLLMLDDFIYDICLDYSKMFGLAYSLTTANPDTKYSALYITPSTDNSGLNSNLTGLN